jgi:hypothetical protein
MSKKTIFSALEFDVYELSRDAGRDINAFVLLGIGFWNLTSYCILYNEYSNKLSGQKIVTKELILDASGLS